MDAVIWLNDHLIQHPVLLSLPFINCMQLSTLKHARLLAVWFIAQLKDPGGDDEIVFGQNRWRDTNKERKCNSG